MRSRKARVGSWDIVEMRTDSKCEHTQNDITLKVRALSKWGRTQNGNWSAENESTL